MAGFLRRLFRRRRHQAQRAVDDEIAMHLDLKTASLIASGMSSDAARAEALRQFGDLAGTAESLRHGAAARLVRRGGRDWMGGWIQDVRHALRSLARTPGVTAAVVVMLALGIGANAAMFGILDRLFLKPPDHVRDPGGVLRVYREGPQSDGRMIPSPAFDFTLYKEMSQNVRGFAAVTAYWTTSYSVGRGQDAVKVDGAIVTGDFFQLLGVSARFGRVISQDDDSPAAPPATVLSHDFWQRHFKGRANVLGDTLRLGPVTYTIVGVMQEGFSGIDINAVDVWVPAHIVGPPYAQRTGMAKMVALERWKDRRYGLTLALLARLSPNSTRAAAGEEATAVFRAVYEDQNRRLDARTRIVLGPLLEWRGPMAAVKWPPLSVVVSGVAAIVLLIACSNVANLLSLRAAARRRELAVRHALGSGRWRVVRMLLVESVLLALVSGVAALAVAGVSAPVLRAALLPSDKWLTPAIDLRVVTVATLVALIIGVVTAFAPAMDAARAEGLDDLRQGRRATRSSRTAGRFAILVTQAALTVVLLVGTGLFYRSFREARDQDIGVSVNHLLVADLSPEERQPLSVTQASVTAMIDRVRRLPDVTGVAVANGRILQELLHVSLRVQGKDSLRGSFSVTAVTPNYFDLIGGRIAHGRGFVDADVADTQRVVIVSDAMARLVWPGEDPLGHCLLIAGSSRCSTVVGVVSDMRNGVTHKESLGQYFVPLSPRWPSPVLVIRAGGNANKLVPAVLRLMAAFHPELPRTRVYALSDEIEEQTQRWRVGLMLFGAAGGLALLLAVVGLYAVIAFGVRQREHEFGIRRALGAQVTDLIFAVLKQGFAVALAGVAMGLAITWYGTRFVAPLLFPDMSAKDPLAMGGAAVILTIVALAACLIPASMAAQADPRQALQAE